jgi:hypothetical protein
LSFPAVAAPYAGTMMAVYAWYPERYGPKDALRAWATITSSHSREETSLSSSSMEDLTLYSVVFIARPCQGQMQEAPRTTEHTEHKL